MTRPAADSFVKAVVVERLSQPDAAGLFRAQGDKDTIESEIAALHLRREELVGLVADGLLPGAAVRDRLATILERLGELEARRSPLTLDPQAFVKPAQVWDAWTTPQRREVLRLLSSRIGLTHVGYRNGPRADPARLQLEWAA